MFQWQTRICLPQFCCDTYMAVVPFWFVPATCVYICSVYLCTLDAGQVFLNSVVATVTSKNHIRSLKAWYTSGQFSKFYNMVSEMTNYSEVLFLVVLFFVHILTSMPVMDLHTCRTLNTVLEQWVLLVIICSIAWRGHWYLLYLFSNIVSTTISLCAVFSDEKDVDARTIWLTSYVSPVTVLWMMTFPCFVLIVPWIWMFHFLKHFSNLICCGDLLL